MKKKAAEDQVILVRAITAAARALGPESPLFPQVVTWLLDNMPALAGLFGEDSQMYWDIQYRRDPAISRDNHIVAVIKHYGGQPEDLEAVRRNFYRWQCRCRAIFAPDAPLGDALWHCLRHLYPPPKCPGGETETFYV